MVINCSYLEFRNIIARFSGIVNIVVTLSGTNVATAVSFTIPGTPIFVFSDQPTSGTFNQDFPGFLTVGGFIN